MAWHWQAVIMVTPVLLYLFMEWRSAVVSKERRQEIAEEWHEFLHPDDRAANSVGDKIRIIKMESDWSVVPGEEGVVLGSNPERTWARFPKEGHKPITVMLYSDTDQWETITEEKK